MREQSRTAQRERRESRRARSSRAERRRREALELRGRRIAAPVKGGEAR